MLEAKRRVIGKMIVCHGCCSVTHIRVPIHRVFGLCDEWAFALCSNRTPHRDRKLRKHPLPQHLVCPRPLAILLQPRDPIGIQPQAHRLF
jgi:hypothetical protein